MNLEELYCSVHSKTSHFLKNKKRKANIVLKKARRGWR
jgi:hypothetical protein